MKQYFIYHIYFLLVTYTDNGHQVHGNPDVSQNRSDFYLDELENSNFSGEWLDTALFEALTNYTPETSKSSRENNSHCTDHGLLYRRHLRNLTMWAVQMYDAGVHSVGGVITADTYQLGHFDECLNISYPAYNVKGKYCLVTLKFGPAYHAYKNYYSPPAAAYFQDPPPDSVVWDKIKTTLDPRMKIRNEIHLGVCIPSSCSYSDVQNSLNETVSYKFSNHNLYGEIYLDKSLCYTKDDNKFDAGFYIMQIILLLLILIASFATIYDYFLKPNDRQEVSSSIILTDKVYNGNGINMKTEEVKKPSKLAESLMAFSLKANMNELVSDGVDKSLDVLNGAKFVCLAVIILGHRTLYTLGSALYNPEYWEESVINFKHMSFMNGTQVVDTFFLIGGFLAFQGVYHQIEKSSRFNLPLLVFFRWLRIMPAYIIIMGIYALLLIHLGSGPLWNLKIGVESENCQETWWLNVLFINNYINPEKQCLLMSWYLACDMHFFIIGACIIYLLWRLPKFANVILGVSLVISLITPFIHVYLGDHDGKLKLYQKLLQQPYLDKEFTSVYVRSHSRSIPYLCGIIIGHICNQFKKSNYTIPRHINIAGISIFFIMYLVQVYSLVIYTPGRSYYALENAVFSALLPLSWSIGSGWILLVQYTTGLGFYKWLFCQKIYTSLSRLSFCAVLIHPAVQVVHAASNVSSEYMVYPKLVWMSCGDITLTYLLALLLYLTVEAPCKNLQKLWLMPDRRNAQPKSLENTVKKNLEQNQEQNHQTTTQVIPMAVVNSDCDGYHFDRSNNTNSTNNR